MRCDAPPYWLMREVLAPARIAIPASHQGSCRLAFQAVRVAAGLFAMAYDNNGAMSDNLGAQAITDHYGADGACANSCIRQVQPRGYAVRRDSAGYGSGMHCERARVITQGRGS